MLIEARCQAHLSYRELVHSLTRQTPKVVDSSLGHESAFFWDGDTSSPTYAKVDHCWWRISLVVRSERNSSRPTLVYHPDSYDPDTVARISDDLLCDLQSIADDLDAQLCDKRDYVRPSIAQSERTEYPKACVHELFESQAALLAGNEAVVYGTRRLTYGDLDRAANRVAHMLLADGIRPEDRVGIFMVRSVEMIVAMLGVLKAGGTYVPIDVEYPAERVRFIAEDADLRLILTQQSVVASLPPAKRFICVDAADSPLHRHKADRVVTPCSPESIAVLSYTSGSTGQPKAALVPHRAIVRTVRDTNYVRVVPTDRVSQAGSPSFDAAIMEIWLALLNGATVVGLNRDIFLSPSALAEAVQRERLSIMILNTSYVHQIAHDGPDAMKGVRKLVFGGETAEPLPLRKLLKHVGPGVLVNSYGPAESCVITSYYEISDIPEDAKSVPIGRPVSNTQVYLLDSHGRPVPVGEQGEVYIGGDGVALGYLNRPELTRERFIPDTFSGQPGRVLYRTGDFARMLPDGNIDFIGRVDEQVKIRGHRIELGEVRHVVASHPAVRQVVLMVREDTPGDKRLVAYITLQPGSMTTQETLRQRAVERLPIEMVPAAFVILDAIPLTVNGKIDRNLLPTPMERPELQSGYAAPQTELEQALTSIWQQLLRLDHVGVHDNFFDLGGHSLLAARLIGRIEKHLGINIPTATLFEAPTIAQLAVRLAQQSFTHAWSPLVPLYVPQNATPLQPFFCVHSLGANLVSFRNVASLMRGDRPIYGLQPHGLDGEQNPFDSIEQMAAAYLEEVRNRQPHGPYYLGGVCLGGVIAFEMAQQLKAVGESTALLVMIDSYAPGKLQYLRSRSFLTEYLDRHLGDMLMLNGVSRARYLARWIANGGVQLRRLAGIRDRSSLAEATRRVTRAHVRALSNYSPKPYIGKIVQFLCSDAAHRSYEDARLAWSSLTGSGLEIRIVPGNHLTMVEEPHARVLAQQLERCLDAASGRV